MNMKKLLTLFGLLLLLAGFVGAASLNGSIIITNSPPAVNSISVSTANVVPGQQFTVTVAVSDANSLQDIQQVKIVLYSSSATQGDADNARNHYTFVWDASTGWSSSPAGYINTTASSTPVDLTTTSGNWVFAIKLDETAEPTNWSVYAYVVDKASTSGSSESTNAFSVQTYVSFSIDDTALNFAGTPGQTGVGASDNPTTVTITSNVNVTISVYGSGDWVGATYGDKIPLGNTKASIDSAGNGAISLTTSPQAIYTNVGYGKGVQKAIYWFLDIPTGIRADTYSTTLYVDVTQS